MTEYNPTSEVVIARPGGGKVAPPRPEDQFNQLAHAIVRWLEQHPDVGDITREHYVAGKLVSVHRQASDQAVDDCLMTAMRFAQFIYRPQDEP